MYVPNTPPFVFLKALAAGLIAILFLLVFPIASASVTFESDGNRPPPPKSIIFDNLGSEVPYNHHEGWKVTGGGTFGNGETLPDIDVAFSFYMPRKGLVSDLWLAITRLEGVNQLNISVATNNNDRPDVTLYSLPVSNKMPFVGDFTNMLVHLTNLSLLLEGDARYWLIASAPYGTYAAWNTNNRGDYSAGLVRANEGEWLKTSDVANAPAGAFRVAIIPEPSTVIDLLLGLGILSALLLRRSRL